MIDPEQAIQRLRNHLGIDNRTIIDFENIIPLQFPIVICIIPKLTTTSMSLWFEKNQLPVPKTLIKHNKKQIRGGIIAKGGGAVIFLDGVDDIHQRRYSLAHEAGHYFIEHFFPREDLIKRLGDSIIEVINGYRLPTPEERVQALLNHTSLMFYTHFFSYENNYSLKESSADSFAFEALAPHQCVLSLLPDLINQSSEIPRIVNVLENKFKLPNSIAELYAHQICCRYGTHPDLYHRFNI